MKLLPLALLAALFSSLHLSAADAETSKTKAKPKNADANVSDAADAKATARKTSPALVPVEEVPGLPRVFLIGDSISMGYTVDVRNLLKGVANVQRPGENGGDTARGLEKLDTWLKTGGSSKWDVIHFNWGLHDLKHMKDGKLDNAGAQVASPEVYEKNLRTLVGRLKQTGAKLIWCSTTPVPEGSPGRVEGDEAKYNAVAKKVMEDEKVAIDDLAGFISPRITEAQRPHNVHFSEEGYQLLAGQVAASIKAQLKK